MTAFEQIEDSEKLYKDNVFFIVKDKYPVTEGHLLIISNEPRKDLWDLTNLEYEVFWGGYYIDLCKSIIENELGLKPDGYNIGFNCGEVAGQSVSHFHCHVIPRYKGDTENPKGGIRHCVEGKGNY